MIIKVFEKWGSFDELSNERIGEIYNTSKEAIFNNLTYHFKGSNKFDL